MAVTIDSRIRLIRIWLLVVAALVFATIVVGGATRLTESGLSIVEWRPVTGTLPPLSDAAWQAEFEKYKAIPQYQTVNRGMSLDAFKTIYWWEWGHRLLGRLIGVAFLVPFVLFLWRRWIPAGLHWRLWAVFVLGGVQGAVGWWMVTSGLADRVSVSQYRLAFHLTLACAIYAALVWIVTRLRGFFIDQNRSVISDASRPVIRFGALALLWFTLLQIYLGALVAGLDAGLAYNTWPLIDGALVPAADRLFHSSPLWRNFFENGLTVQFNHRMAGYLLFAGAIVHAAYTIRWTTGRLTTGAIVLASAITIQAAIGILTLVHQVPLSLALLHQGVAVVVLTIAVLHASQATPFPQTTGGGHALPGDVVIEHS